MLACMLQNLEAIGCLGAESRALTTPLSATQQGDRSHILTGTVVVTLLAPPVEALVSGAIFAIHVVC